jgi:hypothetical protein
MESIWFGELLHNLIEWWRGRIIAITSCNEGRCPRKFGPPNFGPLGPNFLGNMAPLAPLGATFPRKYAPPLRKFGPLENIVYFIAISSEIVKLLLKPIS